MVGRSNPLQLLTEFILRRWSIILISILIFSVYFLFRTPPETKVKRDGNYISLANEPSLDIVTERKKSDDLSSFANDAKRCAISAGKLIKDAISKSKNVETKSSYKDLVTQTDKESEALIRKMISSSYPTHKIIGEEGDDELEITDDPTWIIDPLDGTTNFVHGFPYVAVSIALVLNSEVTVAVVHNPILNETFSAIYGGGSYRNYERIHVSKTDELKNSLVDSDYIQDEPDKIVSAVRSVRRIGSCSLELCNVAMGRIDIYHERDIKVWDYAAGMLIVKEAGGAILQPDEKEFSLLDDQFVAGNSEIVKKFVEHIK